MINSYRNTRRDPPASDLTYCHQKAENVIDKYLKSGLKIKNFVLSFPVFTPGGNRYTVTVVGIQNPGTGDYSFNVSCRSFIQS